MGDGPRIMLARLLMLGALVAGVLGLLAGLVDKMWKPWPDRMVHRRHPASGAFACRVGGRVLRPQGWRLGKLSGRRGLGCYARRKRIR